MLGIIGAMDVEIDAIKARLENKTVTSKCGTDFVCGFIDDVMVCAAKCSPGKVNAALCTQAMIDLFDTDKIINIGVSCSLSREAAIKNVVIADCVCQYDIDITALGEPRGFINGLNRIMIKTSEDLSRRLARAAIRCGEKIHIAPVASGDTFISDSALKEEIHKEFGAICGEMEGGAIGHVCAANNIDFAVLRTISDGGDENAQIDYPLFKKIAAEISTAIILDFIKTEKNQLTLF